MFLGGTTVPGIPDCTSAGRAERNNGELAAGQRGSLGLEFHSFDVFGGADLRLRLEWV